MRAFAPRALAWFGQAQPITKNVLAFQALSRFDHKSFLLRGKGALDVRKVIVHLFFTDSEGHGEVSCSMFIEGKMCYDLLSNGLHIKNMIVFYAISGIDAPFPSPSLASYLEY
jgi:hypothetical protein